MRDEDGAVYRRTMEMRLQFWGGVLLRLAVLAFGVYVLWRVRAVVTVVLASLVVACAVKALVDPLCRQRWGFVKPHMQRVIATSFVFLVLAASMIVIGKLFVSPFQAEFRNLVNHWPAYQVQLETYFNRVQDWYAALPEDFRNFVGQRQESVPTFSPAEFFTDFGKKTMAWASHAVEFFLIPVLAFYFTLDGRTLRNQFLFLVPRRRLRQTIAILDESNSIMRAYIISQFWLAVLAGVIVGVSLKLIGMEYALILGVFAAITRAIPVIGPFIGGIPLVLLTFAYGMQINNPYLWIVASLAFGLMHIVESKLIMPQFLGQALNLHAVIIIIALLIGGEFFGLMGMFLAAPVAALIRVLVMHYFILPNRRSVATNAVTKTPQGGRILRLERAVRASQAIPASLSTTAATIKSFAGAEAPTTTRD
ncbi:MAG: AI-2E family transporter [Capsulimonadales bacterium]|nr:AI-2E family transporter [Capsulimonadales bacterium]